MLDVDKSLPKDPVELRQFTALLLAEVKSQAMLIKKLRHQLAGQRHHRFGSSSESIEQLQLALETSEIAVAKMTAKLRLPDEEPKDKPKRRPIPDHIPRMEVELTTGDDDCAHCGGGLRRLGEDVTEELEYVPGCFIVNRIVRPRFACSGCEAFKARANSVVMLAGARTVPLTSDKNTIAKVLTDPTPAWRLEAGPEVGMRSEAMRHAQSLLSEFGLTPSARSKVSAGKPQEVNPFAALEREFGL